MGVGESPEKGGGLGPAPSVFHPDYWTWRWSLDQGWPLVLWSRIASFTVYFWLRLLSAGIDYKWEGAPKPDLNTTFILVWANQRSGLCVASFLERDFPCKTGGVAAVVANAGH